MDNILKIDKTFIFRYYDNVALYFDHRDILAKDINLPIQYKGVRHCGGGDYVYKVIYELNDFDKYNHYKFENKKGDIQLQIKTEIKDKIFESKIIVIGVFDFDSKVECKFKNCTFICDKLYLPGKVGSVDLINCDLSKVKNISI